MKILLPLLILIVAIGCGGSGASGGTTSSGGLTSTTGSSTTSSTTSSSETTGSGLNSLTLTPGSGTIYSHTTSATSVLLTASVTGVNDPTLRYNWESLGQYQSGNGTVVVPPGNQGTFETLSGQPITGPTVSPQVLYVGTPATMIMLGQDQVRVTASTSTATSTWRGCVINVGTDWTTLPPGITSLAASITVSPKTVVPGAHLVATVSFYPNIAASGGTLDLNGIIPTSVTVNGAPATWPITWVRAPRDPAATYVVDMVIPAGTANMYPVQASRAGETGPWVDLESSAYGVSTAYFIHS